MNHPVVVRESDGVGGGKDVAEEREPLFPTTRAADRSIERRAAHLAHHVKWLVVLPHAAVVDGHDPRMLELGRDAPLAQKAVHAVASGLYRRRKKLDGNAAAELQVLGFVDTAHPSFPEQGNDPVAPHRLTDQSTVVGVRVAWESGRSDELLNQLADERARGVPRFQVSRGGRHRQNLGRRHSHAEINRLLIGSFPNGARRSQTPAT